MGKTVIVSDDNVVAQFIRNGVRFEDAMNAIASYSLAVRFIWWGDRFEIRDPLGNSETYADVGPAIHAYLKALTKAVGDEKGLPDFEPGITYVAMSNETIEKVENGA